MLRKTLIVVAITIMVILAVVNMVGGVGLTFGEVGDTFRTEFTAALHDGGCANVIVAIMATWNIAIALFMALGAYALPKAFWPKKAA